MVHLSVILILAVHVLWVLAKQSTLNITQSVKLNDCQVALRSNIPNLMFAMCMVFPVVLVNLCLWFRWWLNVLTPYENKG